MPTRRTALAALAALPLLPRLPNAAAPPAGRQVPGIHRLRVGRFEVTALLDVHIDLPEALFPGLGAEAPALLRDAFLPAGPVRTAVAAFAVNTGERLYLLDAGTGTGFAPSLGDLPAAMRAAGLEPAQVDAVLLTHLHPDHAGGLLRDGAALFPNAEIVVTETEAAFWLDGAAAHGGDTMRGMADLARAVLAPYGQRLRHIPLRAATVAPGIEVVPLPGHTPGHAGFLIADGGEALLMFGDAVHVGPFQLPRPELAFGFDVDGQAAIASRRRVLDRAASERLLVAGVHLPFPGFGHIARAGQGYAFVPRPFLPL